MLINNLQGTLKDMFCTIHLKFVLNCIFLTSAYADTGDIVLLHLFLLPFPVLFKLFPCHSNGQRRWWNLLIICVSQHKSCQIEMLYFSPVLFRALRLMLNRLQEKFNTGWKEKASAAHGLYTLKQRQVRYCWPGTFPKYLGRTGGLHTNKNIICSGHGFLSCSETSFEMFNVMLHTNMDS